MARSALIIVSACLCFSFGVRAHGQDVRRASWAEPSCVPTWWDSTLLSALRVELRELGIEVLLEGDSSEEPNTTQIFAAPTSCEPEATSVRIEVRLTSHSRIREVDLADIAPAGRSRTLALAIASTVAGAMLVVSDAAATEETEEASEVEEQEFAPSLEEDAAFGRVDEPASALAAASNYEPTSARRGLASLEVGADGAWLPSRSVALGGARASVVLRPFPELPSLVLFGGARGLFGSSYDLLGEVRGSYFDGTLGTGFEDDLGAIRVGIRGAITLGAAIGEGVPAREGVIGRSELAPILAIELAAQLDLAILGPFAVYIDAHISVIVLGLDARAGARSALPLRDVMPGLRLGVRLDL